ncbi:MAG: hypothetical protein Q8908_04750 [Bacteroidota bacterium]|nr:hypothetical protein [Bacteroidota bacterium]
MKSLILFVIFSLTIGFSYGQMNSKKQVTVTKSDSGKAHVKIEINNDGKETILDTTVMLDHGKMPIEIDKMIRDAKPGQRKFMIELDSTFREPDFDFSYQDRIRDRLDQLQKKMRPEMPNSGLNLPDQKFLKDFDFNFNNDDFSKNLRLKMMPSFAGRLHKLSDEEFSRLRDKGIFTEKEDLAEQLDVRYVSLTPCGQDCFVLNFVSKEKGKIAITLCDKDGKTISTSEAAAISSKEINGRTVYSCVISENKDKKFTFLKLTKENKLAIFSEGF